MSSIGTIGDSFDNALAESVKGYCKAELIYGPAGTGPWKTVEDVEPTHDPRRQNHTIDTGAAPKAWSDSFSLSPVGPVD
ncbi:hypothetical protein MHEC_41550 [Mycobacterium heckeshornense]|uniref:Integrase catalytic domain-containing protein n=1 Tax=Mycobacterium heckeshornense TaxID=110505 RepID=A0A7R7GXK5_9MYCO|nr:hypothetical protein MHEC_41550 [Mycobacterium heckeshornense]